MVEGVNSTQVQLVWNFTNASSFFILITRRRPTESQTTRIAVRTQNTDFSVRNCSRYEANLPVTLVIKDATRNEFVYRVSITDTGDTLDEIVDEVTVNVLCKSQRSVSFIIL